MKSILAKIVGGIDLSLDEMQQATRIIMQGNATDAQIGSFLTALEIKGVCLDELQGAAQVMRSFSLPVRAKSRQLVDCVGTGGDGAKLFNVSTASAFVAAAGGAVVAKHGNRAASGNCGSADLLEAAGINIQLNPSQVAGCIDDLGIGFLFAPMHHAATKHVIGPRKELGFRTLFNLLGPLTNPAEAKSQLVGVFSDRWLVPMAECYQRLGSQHTLVVHSADGLDEISLAASTNVCELDHGKIRNYQIAPQDFGITLQSLDSLRVDNPQHSLTLIKEALSGTIGPAFDMVSLNAGATLYVGGQVDSLQSGVEKAVVVLRSGKALELLEQLAIYSNPSD